jgi:hypothetical protein
VAGVPWVHQSWVGSDERAVKGDQGVHVHRILKRVQGHDGGVQRNEDGCGSLRAEAQILEKKQ